MIEIDKKNVIVLFEKTRLYFREVRVTLRLLNKVLIYSDFHGIPALPVPALSQRPNYTQDFEALLRYDFLSGLHVFSFLVLDNQRKSFRSLHR